MPTAFTRILLSLLLLLPLAAHAGDAQDFVAANPAKQASLLESWSAAPDAARLPLARIAIRRLLPEHAAMLAQLREGAADLYALTPEALAS